MLHDWLSCLDGHLQLTWSHQWWKHWLKDPEGGTKDGGSAGLNKAGKKQESDLPQ